MVYRRSLCIRHDAVAASRSFRFLFAVLQCRRLLNVSRVRLFRAAAASTSHAGDQSILGRMRFRNDCRCDAFQPRRQRLKEAKSKDDDARKNAADQQAALRPRGPVVERVAGIAWCAYAALQRVAWQAKCAQRPGVALDTVAWRRDVQRRQLQQRAACRAVLWRAAERPMHLLLLAVALAAAVEEVRHVVFAPVALCRAHNSGAA